MSDIISPNSTLGTATDYKQAYWDQQSHAKQRNIDWQFTYESWLEWWGEDIQNRGCRKGQLVMARYGDVGPYHPSNVRKATTMENHQEAKVGNQHSAKTIQTPLGVFDSRIKAAEAHKVNVCTIRKRLLKQSQDYFYVNN